MNPLRARQCRIDFCNLLLDRHSLKMKTVAIIIHFCIPSVPQYVSASYVVADEQITEMWYSNYPFLLALMEAIVFHSFHSFSILPYHVFLFFFPYSSTFAFFFFFFLFSGSLVSCHFSLIKVLVSFLC